MSYLSQYDIPSCWIGHLGRRWKALLGLGFTTLSEALGSTQPGCSLQQGSLTHHIALPHVLDENNASLVKYKSEKFPQALTQGSKIAIVLKPPTQDHWNIALDPILPWILVDSQSQREAQQVAQAKEEGSKEAALSQPEVPTHGEPPGILIGGGGKSLPMKTVPDREQVLETTREILGCIHTLHLQMMHKMGSVREVDWTLA